MCITVEELSLEREKALKKLEELKNTEKKLKMSCSRPDARTWRFVKVDDMGLKKPFFGRMAREKKKDDLQGVFEVVNRNILEEFVVEQVEY